jgi:hypothetical protein
LSLVSRLLGFGLCLLGSGILGYAEGLISVPTSVYTNLITHESGDVLGLAPSMISSVTNYIQTSIAPNTGTYLALGAVLVLCGAALVAIGDRRFGAGPAPPKM